MTIAIFIATVAAGLFAGASLYVSVVQHPAWIESGAAAAIKEFGPSTRRAAILQGGLAMIAMVSGAVAWFQGFGVGWLVGGLLLGVMAPFTIVVIQPVNRRLLDPQLDPGSREAAELFSRWGRLHAVRTVAGVAALVAFVVLSLRP